jgi:hypothetical protein
MWGARCPIEIDLAECELKQDRDVARRRDRREE